MAAMSREEDPDRFSSRAPRSTYRSSHVVLTPLGDGFAALLASVANTLVSYPLDLVKTRFQAHDGLRLNLPRYSSTWAALTTIVRTEGPRALYRGAGAGVLGAALAWSSYMALYAALKEQCEDRGIALSWWIVGVCSLTGGIGVQVLTNPVWVIKTRLQLQVKDMPGTPTPYRSARDAVWRIYREEGVRAFYRGLVPGIWSAWHGVVQFVAYEGIAGVLLRATGQDRVGGPLAAVAGGISKVLALVTTYPLTVVKTRRQEKRGAITHELSVPKALRAIQKAEGFRGLYKGLAPSMWRLSLHSALFFSLFEEARRTLGLVGSLRRGT